MLSSKTMNWLASTSQALMHKAEGQKLAHATLVTGPRGIGKLNCIRDFARALLCESAQSVTGCGSCKSCGLFDSGSHPDFLFLEPEEAGKALKVDAIREVGDFAQRSSHAGGARVIILYQAHALNVNAANALLKTLEEPNEQTFMFLISDQPGLLSATIRSRCQILHLTLPSEEEALSWLEQRVKETEEISFDSQLVQDSLKAARGGPLWAFELLQAGALPQSKEIGRELRALLAGQSEAESLLAALLAVEPLSAVEQLVIESGELAKSILLTGSTPAQQLQEPLKSHVAKAPAHFAKRAITLHDEFEHARRQLSSVSNPNPKLLLESLSYLASRAFH